MSSKMTLYLSILVSAPAAEIQALNSAGGSYPRSGYDIMSSKMTLYLRILVTAPATEIQALNSAGGSYLWSGYDIDIKNIQGRCVNLGNKRTG